MRRAVLTLLAVAGVGCALVVTAASTTTQARAAGMTGPVPWALVGLLEVVSIVGTWTWITDARPRVRGEAAVGVVAASGVTAWCGAATYGPLGLVAPLGLLAAVHLVSRMWAVEDARPERVVVEGVDGLIEKVADADTPRPREEDGASGPGDEPGRGATTVAQPVRLDQQDVPRRAYDAVTTSERGAAPTGTRAA